MKTLLIYLSLAASLIAGEVPELVPTAAPNGAFYLSFVEVGETNTQRLEIKDKDGKVVFSSPPQINGDDISRFFPEHLRWSPDSKLLAISAGHAKYFKTYLFAWNGTGFQQVRLPEIAAGMDNPWIFPVGWKEDHILNLEMSGPHAGKAEDRGYEGRAAVQVDLKTKTCKKLSEEVKHYDADE
jgi:hypothetical protein